MFKFANVAASQTDSALVAAVAGHKIRVLGYIVQVGAVATDVTFNSKPAGAGSAISMTHQCGANGGLAVPREDNEGWFETLDGQGLTVTTGAGSTAGIQLVYTLIKGV